MKFKTLAGILLVSAFSFIGCHEYDPGFVRKYEVVITRPSYVVKDKDRLYVGFEGKNIEAVTTGFQDKETLKVTEKIIKDAISSRQEMLFLGRNVNYSWFREKPVNYRGEEVNREFIIKSICGDKKSTVLRDNCIVPFKE